MDAFPFQNGDQLIHKSGKFVNTTRQEVSQSYTYMWMEHCSYSVYTPSNQFLFHNPNANYK